MTTTSGTTAKTTIIPATTIPVTITKKLDGVTDDMVDFLVEAIGTTQLEKKGIFKALGISVQPRPLYWVWSDTKTKTQPATTTTPATTTHATTTPTPFFARMGITYESWLKMNAIHLKLFTHGSKTGSTFSQRYGITQKSWSEFISIKKEMNAYARKVNSGEIQIVNPWTPCTLELLGHWSCKQYMKLK